MSEGSKMFVLGDPVVALFCCNTWCSNTNECTRLRQL